MRMPWPRRMRGDDAPGPRGERFAIRDLKRQGYRLLAKNLRDPHGELDALMLAPDRRTLVIVEVKTRVGQDGPRPEVRVGSAKQRQLLRLAARVARRLALTDRPIRVDVVGVDLTPDGQGLAELRHWPGAVTSPV